MVPTDDRQMWQELGLDLEAHDGLLTVLGQAYEDVYLRQPNRPRAMEYFDFVVSQIHGLRVRELLQAKEGGRKVVAAFCVFVPEEVVLAAGGVLIGLCGGAEVGFDLAEQYLPQATCPLIKSFFGFKLARLCPYIELADLVVGETTCDGKKKAYESFHALAPVHVMELPQMKNPADRVLWRTELARFVDRIEALTGNRVTDHALREAVGVVNAKRRALARLAALRSADPAPISGLDALLVNQISFYDDPERFTAKVHELCDELEERVARGQGVAPQGAPRILVSGSPMAIPNWKVPRVIESCGAVVVGEESCVGSRNFRDLVDEGPADREELLDAIAERQLRIECACFTPNAERVDTVARMARELGAHGVVHYNLSFCTPYAAEALRLDRELRGRGVRMLRLETDYSQDEAQVRTRVEAFLEMLAMG
ncbi:double-cubane-cluster-containing anaerobic reductase [Deferrisoma camini]|uniref:double-cubane-cluster-containing anaerobic reductase n=1 Tax=Deferrisoma camini TaxID=1035120 RepID=UPI00046D616F|nr:double-cubane-cluster-containing anaerobic reductase [Deferrisoma camini]